MQTTGPRPQGFRSSRSAEGTQNMHFNSVQGDVDVTGPLTALRTIAPGNLGLGKAH